MHRYRYVHIWAWSKWSFLFTAFKSESGWLSDWRFQQQPTEGEQQTRWNQTTISFIDRPCCDIKVESMYLAVLSRFGCLRGQADQAFHKDLAAIEHVDDLIRVWSFTRLV